MDAATSDNIADAVTRGSALGLVASAKMPIEIGDFVLDHNGQLTARFDDEPICFSFRYRNFTFEGSIEPGHHALIRLRTDCGYLPYTAESPEARQCVRQIIRESHRIPGARLRLSDRQVISLESEAVPPAPRTPVSVVSTLVSLLLKSRPLLTLMDDLLKPTRAHRARMD
jgi:hypothetical protein